MAQVMKDIFTAHDVADRLNVSLGRVYQLAHDRGLGTKKGLWLFTRDDIESMSVRIAGRPRKNNPCK
jgi:hypothetical protein